MTLRASIPSTNVLQSYPILVLVFRGDHKGRGYLALESPLCGYMPKVIFKVKNIISHA